MVLISPDLDWLCQQEEAGKEFDGMEASCMHDFPFSSTLPSAHSCDSREKLGI